KFSNASVPSYCKGGTINATTAFRTTASIYLATSRIPTHSRLQNRWRDRSLRRRKMGRVFTLTDAIPRRGPDAEHGTPDCLHQQSSANPCKVGRQKLAVSSRSARTSNV